MISLRWLREFADLPEDGEEVAAALSNLGHEVEGMRRVTPPFSRVVVARVLEVRPHPRAERLRLVRLDTGSGEQEVVCGAWTAEEKGARRAAPWMRKLLGWYLRPSGVAPAAIERLRTLPDAGLLDAALAAIAEDTEGDPCR